MQLNFRALQRDAFGRVETPTLMLKKPHDAVIGPLGDYHSLKLNPKYNELSEGSFVYPKRTTAYPDGTPLYAQLVPDKLVQIDPYGVFVVREAEEHVDEKGCYKNVSLYSLEYELAGKKLILGQGTYPLWNAADPDNCLLFLALEGAPNWRVGYVDPDIALRYRTFDDVDSGTLDFLQGQVQESYGAVVVFDTYHRTVNVYDAEKPASLLPVYLSYDNLLKSGTMKELGENLITKLYVQGADGVDIRGVNPTGENYLYNLDWYIVNGDIDKPLADRWIAWQERIASRRDYYSGLVMLRSAATMRHTAEAAKLTDLNNQLATQENLRAAHIQNRESAPAGSAAYATSDARIDEINQEIHSLQRQISDQTTVVDAAAQDVAKYAQDIASINAQLKPTSFFEEAELQQLDYYFKEESFQDETFAVFDTAVVDGGSLAKAERLTAEWTDVVFGAQVVDETSATPENTLWAVRPSPSATNPIVSISSDDGAWSCRAAFVSGAIDVSNRVATLVVGAGSITSGGTTTTFPNGTVTIVGTTLALAEATSKMTVFNASVHFTSNATGYQQNSVEMSLYEHAEAHLRESASPTYEFEVSSGNILFQTAFQPFSEQIALGGRCYLQLDEDRCLSPVLLEIQLEFEHAGSFSLVFANTFRRPDQVNNLKDMLKEATSASRTLNSKKLSYGENSNTTTWVKTLLEQGFDAAMTQINSGESSVTFGKAGLKVQSLNGPDTIYLGNGMIALDDGTSVKLAMGHFLNSATGTDYVGILADVIGGTLLAGKNLVIECPSAEPDGKILQFKVDASGVFIHNGRFYMQDDGEGRAVCIDPTHGFILGKAGMLEWDEAGNVTTSWPGENSPTWESFKDQTNVALLLSEKGEAYFKGTVYATNGYFEGEVKATSGEFTGTVKANAMYVKGQNVLTAEGKFDRDCLDLGNIQLDGTSGDITMRGNINLSDASSINWGNNVPIKYQYSTNNSSWHDAWSSYDKYRRESYDGGNTWGAGYQFVGTDGKNGSNANVPSYITSTYIDASSVASPAIRGGIISGAKFTNLTGTVENPSYSHYLTMGNLTDTGQAALKVHSTQNETSPFFAVGDTGMGTTTFYAQSDSYGFLDVAMATGTEEAYAKPYGTWDFEKANVTGLYFRFA